MSSKFRISSPLIMASAASVAYALSLGLLWARQTHLLYRAPKGILCEDDPGQILSATGSEPAMKGWVDGPKESSDCVIYFGGSSEPIELRRENLAHPCENMTRYFMPYRGFGPNYGMKISELALKSDGVRLFDQLAHRHDRVHIVARSLGTGVGINVAANRPVDGLALITPYDSIAAVATERYRVVPANHLLRDRFESWRDAGKITKSALVCLAGLDKVISPRRWEELKRHFTVAPVEKVFESCDHTNISACTQMWREIGEFIQSTPVFEPPRVNIVFA